MRNTKDLATEERVHGLVEALWAEGGGERKTAVQARQVALKLHHKLFVQNLQKA